MKSKDYKYGTLGYYRARVKELETERDTYEDESKYYRVQLAKSHEILGRTIHQLSERWDSVRLTEYYPTDNLWGKRTVGNPKGEKR